MKDLNAPIQVGEGAYTCIAPEGWNAVAEEIAAQLGGIGRPSASKTGASWQRGPVVSGNLIDPGLYPAVLAAQGVVRSLVPDAPLKWTLGGCSRQLFAYVGESQETNIRTEFQTPWANALRYMPPACDRLLEGIEYGYHECAPGLYDYAEHWDVSGYYYEMMRRARSIRLIVYEGGFEWVGMPPDEWKRWQEVLTAVAPHKPLRNSLAGAAAGSTFGVGEQQIGYSRVKGSLPPGKGEGYTTKCFPFESGPGPFRAFGLLLVRTGYEKTFQECRQNNTIYANIDCVICTPDRKPVWEKFDLPVLNAHKGETHIIARGNWQCGNNPKDKTKNYGAGEAVETPVAGRTDPLLVEYGTWL